MAAKSPIIQARTMFAIQPEEMEAFRLDVLHAIDAVAIIHFGPRKDNHDFFKDKDLPAFFKLLDTVLERDLGGIVVDNPIPKKVDIIT